MDDVGFVHVACSYHVHLRDGIRGGHSHPRWYTRGYAHEPRRALGAPRHPSASAFASYSCNWPGGEGRGLAKDVLRDRLAAAKCLLCETIPLLALVDLTRDTTNSNNTGTESEWRRATRQPRIKQYFCPLSSSCAWSRGKYFPSSPGLSPPFYALERTGATGGRD